MTEEIQKNALYSSPSDIKPVAEHRHGTIKGNYVSNDNNEHGNVESIRHIGNIRDMRNEEKNGNNVGMGFAEQTNTQVKKQSLKQKIEEASLKKNTNEKDVSVYKNKEAVNTLSALNIGSKVNDKHVGGNKKESDSETLTVVEKEEPEEKNIFKNILNSIYSMASSQKRHYYHMRLNEQNFRWSLPVLLGSQKQSLLLHIVTSTPFTALYCSMNSKKSGSAPILKYELTTSEDGYLIECRSDQCESLTVKKVCQPLNVLLPALTGFSIKKRTCKERFCDYVHNINFLNLEKISEETNLSLCSFDYKVGYDNVKGFYFSDSFYIKKNVKDTYDYLGCITENEDLKLNDVNSGFLGLATYDVHQKKTFPSILNSFIQNSYGRKNIFALCLVEKGGFVTFGGYEYSVFKSRPDGQPDSNVTKPNTPEQNVSVQKLLNFYWLNYSNTRMSIYKLLLKGIACAEKDKIFNVSIDEDVVADTYNYYLHVPEAFFTKINALITEKCKADTHNVCTEIHDKGLLTITNGRVNDYPKIQLIFDDASVYIEPNDYIIQTSDNKYKILLKTSNVTKLGIPFFLNKYVVFDNTKNKLGIGRSECKLNIGEDDLTGIYSFEEDPFVQNNSKQEKDGGAYFEIFSSIAQVIFMLGAACLIFGVIYSCFS